MDNPRIEWIQKSGEICLKFTFQGNFSKQDAGDAIIRWREALANHSRKRIVHIWDCHDMNDYDQEARRLWIDTCKELRLQIDTIWLISTSLLISMGAKIISLMTYLEIRVVPSEKDIHM